MDRQSPRIQLLDTRKIVAILRLERQFSLVQAAAPAVPVTLAGPRPARTIGPITIRTVAWSTDGPNTKVAGTTLIPTMGARWPTMVGSRQTGNGIVSHQVGSCMRIHGFDSNMEASIIITTSNLTGQWHMMNGLANSTSTPKGSGSEIHNRSNLFLQLINQDQPKGVS